MRRFTVVYLLIGAALFATTSCMGTGERVRAEKTVVPLSERYNELSDVIRTLPNVQVEGDYVTFRGTSTLTGDEQMRFLVEGRVVGTYAQAASLFPLTEIRRVRLIRPQQAASNFGQLGSNGLIELVLMP